MEARRKAQRVHGSGVGRGGCSVGSEQKSNGKELLSERERESLKILAREIVKEAGLKEDREIAAWRASLMSQLDMFKHLSTLSGAAAVAIVVLYKGLDRDVASAGMSLALVGVAFVVALYFLFTLSSSVIDPNTPARSLARALTIGGYATFVSGVALFAGVGVLIFVQ
jgi:hypothetical protein